MSDTTTERNEKVDGVIIIGIRPVLIDGSSEAADSVVTEEGLRQKLLERMSKLADEIEHDYKAAEALTRVADVYHLLGGGKLFR